MLALLAEACFAVLPKPAYAADEYDQLREKWKSFLIGGTYSPADPDIAAQLAVQNATAQQYWDTLDTSPTRTYLWSDLDDALAETDNGISSNITLTYRRLEAMALAYATNGCALYQNSSLLADIIAGLDWMNANKYNSARTKIGNWFDWEISTPLSINNSTVLLYDELTPTQITNYMDAIDFFNPTVTMTGANRVWESTVIGVRGVIVKNGTKLTAAKNGLTNVFAYVTSGDGFYRDGSFVQHTKFAYTGGYGSSLLSYLVNVVYLLSGSTWAVTDPGLQNMYRWVYDSFEPIMYKGLLMDMSRGREISRRTDQDHVGGMRVVKAVLQMSQYAPPADAAKLKSMVKYWIGADTFYPFYANAGSIYHLVLAKSIMNDTTILPGGEPVGYKQYAGMDRAVLRRPDFSFALSLSSSRIANYEAINSENLKGWYTGDGMTYLYNGDLGQYSDEYWALVNKYRLPGTTVDTRTRSNNSGSAYLSGKNWVGGASVAGLYGVTGMDLQAYGSTLTAKKSWFMFADKVVALGADIQSTDGRRIETIVDNRKLDAAGGNALTVGGVAKSTALGWSETMSGVNRVHLAGNVPGSDIGYYFPGGVTLKANREARTGTWQSVNTYAKATDTTVLTRNFLSLWLDHGISPSAASYAYVVLPNKTAAQLDSYAANPDIAILENSAAAQAVKDTTLGATGINFWNDVTKTVYDSGSPVATSTKKAAVMLMETEDGLELGVSDPTQANTGVIELEIHRSTGSVVSADTGVTVTQLSPTIKLSVNVSGAKGKTFAVKFSGAPASAIVVDHFDAGATGSAPAGWAIDAAGGTAGLVEEPSATNKSLRLSDTSTNAAVVARHSFAPSTSSVTAEFKLKAGAESLYAAQLMSGSVNAVRLRTASGKLQVSNGGTYTDLQSYTAGNWYTLKIVANPATQKADIYVDGVLRQSQGAFNAAAASLDAIQFATHGATGAMTMYVDDVTVAPSAVIAAETFDTLATGTAPPVFALETSGGTAVVADVPGATNKSLKLSDSSTTAPVIARRAFAPRSTPVTAEFKVRLGAENLYAAQLFSGAAVAVRIRSYGGKLQVQNGTTYTNLASYTAGAWHRIKITADPATQKADIYVDGVLRQSQGAFATAVSAIDTLQFATHTATSGMTMYVDEVVVSDN